MCQRGTHSIHVAQGESLHCALLLDTVLLKNPRAHPFQMPLNLGHPNYPS